MALYARQGAPGKGGSPGAFKGKGQVVDAAIYEAVWGVMEGVICDYDGAGIVRKPSGSTITGIVPTNTYNTKDGKAIVIGANSDSLFKRLLTQAGRSDIAKDPKFATNVDRVRHQPELDAAIEAWTNSLTAEEVLVQVQKANVPNGLIYSVADIDADPQYNARGMIEVLQVPELNRTIKVPGLCPKLTGTPGKSNWAGGWLGEHTEEIIRDVLKYSNDEARTLVDDGSLIWPDRIQKPWM